MSDRELLRSSPSGSAKYRADIDGLRTIAVLPVVFFHAGLGFSGGFVGVDIFFVISGYLITQVLLRDWVAGRYSIAAFYERRIRRIVPALVVVIVFCIAGSLALLIPQDYQDFSLSVVATTAFLSNVLFYDQAGYFATAAHYKPLLHTWSLAVEEQYYILYPLILFVTLKYARRYLPLVVFLGLVLSLGLSEYAVWKRPDAAFYLSPFRAWELLIGSFVALDVLPEIRNRFAREGFATVSLAFIAYSVSFYSSDTPFPGFAALLPCLGAAGLIHTSDRTPTFIGTVMSTRPFVFVGLISYSLYLWHWPLLVFTHLVLLRALTPPEGAAIAVVSVAIAALSWRYVEQPFRKAQSIGRRPLFLVTGIAAVMLLAAATAGHVAQGFPQRFSKPVARMASYANSRELREWLTRKNLSDCFLRTHVDERVVTGCMMTPAHRRTILVWGDSHAAHSFPGIEALARRNGLAARLATMRGCLPLAAGRRKAECETFDRLVVARLIKSKYAAVVVMGHWFDSQARSHGDEAAGGLLDDIYRTLKIVHAAGMPVILVGPLPEYDEPLPIILARQLAWPNKKIAVSEHLEADAVELDRKMKARFGRMEGVTYVSAMESMCPNGMCVTKIGDTPVYLDQSHFSVVGALTMVSPMIDKPLTAATR